MIAVAPIAYATTMSVTDHHCGRNGCGNKFPGYTQRMEHGLGEPRLAAWRAFLNAHAVVISRIERELAEAGQLPLTSYDVLVALSEAPGCRLRMYELANAVVLSRSGLTRLVDRLETEGLLTRERSGGDRRGAFAVLTQRGAAALLAAWPIYAHGIAAHFARYLTDAEVSVLTAALERVDAGERKRLIPSAPSTEEPFNGRDDR